MAESIPPASDGPLLFGRYRVLHELGRGGMGVVQLAHDEELHLHVALKLVPAAVVQDAEAIDGLKKEVLRGRELTHPGIVRTHDFARDSDSAAIVMEYVEGCTLADLKTHQPDRCFDPVDIRPWLEQLCPILDYAHRDARIVHRDLKPANFMLTAAGRVKVADFGIASRLPDPDSGQNEATGKGGTARYMSPQQAQGFAPSPLDDVYSLGATIYELLTSKPPFLGSNILPQVLQVMPRPMTARREELGIAGRAAISPVWEEAIAACLAKEPEDRPQSAGELLHRLKTPPYVPLVVMNPQPLALRPYPDTLSVHASKAAASQRAWSWGIGIVIVTFAAIAVWFGSREPKSTNTSAASPETQPAVRLRAIVTATSRTGFVIRNVSKGTQLTIRYGGGAWRSSHRTNVDDPDEDGHPIFNRLAVAMPFADGKRGAVLAVLPLGTAKQPFVFKATQDYPEIVLRINDEEDSLAFNDGTTEWDVEIQRPMISSVTQKPRTLADLKVYLANTKWEVRSGKNLDTPITAVFTFQDNNTFDHDRMGRAFRWNAISEKSFTLWDTDLATLDDDITQFSATGANGRYFGKLKQ